MPSQSAHELGDILNAQTNYNPIVHMKVLRLRPDTRKMLEDFYSQHNEELARILSDEAFTWRDTARKRALMEMEEEEEQGGGR